MKKLSFLFCFSAVIAKLGAQGRESASLAINEFLVESAVSAFFLTNSNNVVEVTMDNYPELYQSFVDLSVKAKINTPLLFLITKKHPLFFSKTNACAVGGRDASAVFVGSWLIDELSADEVQAILAHEITHIAHEYSISSLKFMLGSFAVSLSAAILGYKLTGYAKDCPWYLRWTAASFGWGFAHKLFSLISFRHAREQEKVADLGAIELTGNMALIGALEKCDEMVKKYCPYSARKRKETIERLFSSHPLTEERVAYIRARGAEQKQAEKDEPVSVAA